jgi:DNA-damage-inducible protein D
MTKPMSMHSALFENEPIRRVYEEASETWWFSVVDIIRVLTQQSDATVARKYWNKLKQRLRAEGSELVTKCHQLKLTAEDGKTASPGCSQRDASRSSLFMQPG